MGTYSAKGGKDFEKASEGTHLACCTLVADVGLQPGSGQFPDPKVKVFFRFEIPSERISYEKDGKQVEGPVVIYSNYTASMNDKSNMRKAIESWRGSKFTDQEAELFDIHKLLGQTCLIQIVHTPDGKYANVANIMAPPKGTAKLKPENTCIYFGQDDDKAYDQLPKFLKEKWDNQIDPATKSLPAMNERKGKLSAADIEADRIAAQQDEPNDDLTSDF